MRRTGTQGGDQSCRFWFSGEEGRYPGPDTEKRIRDSAHMEQRHGDEVRVALTERQRRGQVGNVIDQRALVQQHAFRPSGGARAVYHQGGIGVGYRTVRVDSYGLCCGEQGFVLAAQHHDAFQVGDSPGEGLHRGVQLGADEKQARAAVVEHVDEFVADNAPVDHGGHGADRGGRNQGFQAGRVILVQERHALAALQAGGSQRTGHPANPQRPLRPGPLLVAEVNRNAVGPLRGVLLDETDECLPGVRGGIGWWHSLHSAIRIALPRTRTAA